MRHVGRRMRVICVQATCAPTGARHETADGRAPAPQRNWSTCDARERAAVADGGAARADRVQLPPEQQRPDELHDQQLGIDVAQPAVGDQAPHDRLEPRPAAAHPLEQVDAAFAREPHAVGHQDAKELLLPRQDEAVERRTRRAARALSRPSVTGVVEQGATAARPCPPTRPPAAPRRAIPCRESSCRARFRGRRRRARRRAGWCRSSPSRQRATRAASRIA